MGPIIDATPNGYVNGEVEELSTENGENPAKCAHKDHGKSISASMEFSKESDYSSNTPPFESCAKKASDHTVEPLAIIGMAMRLPGGVHDAESFWDLLINKRNGRCLVPADRYNIDAWYGPGKPGHVGSRYGYFLEDLNLANMDANFWSMSKHEIESMDPQQRILLEVVYECLENAGAMDWRGKNIGCFVGSFGEDWLDMDLQDTENAHMYRHTGYSDYISANRVSYEFDFRGPSVTSRTACSSSLTGLHEACRALCNRECKAAVVSGTNIIITPRMTIAMSEQGVISPTGMCKSFDADADGYARGEAVSALYIKKLNDALRDGDHVRAVIRSTCVNSDGKTAGLSLPSTEAHEALIRKGHELAGLADFSKTAMIECHGTGTKIGDPIETKAVANVFGEHGIYIGSVKPNLGHSEGASGLSSVMKMVLALEHKIIPPNINFKKPNPAIPWQEAKLKVPISPTEWPADCAERVCVNSFGFGGANAHLVLESLASYRAEQSESECQSKACPEDRPNLLAFSARHPESLRKSIENHASYLASHAESLNDMSYTLRSKRQTLTHRAFCIAQDGDFLETSNIKKPEKKPNLIFVFTGQGAQWAQMGRELFSLEPLFAVSIAKLGMVLSALPDPPSWSLQDEILKTQSRSRLSEAEISQPCCTAIQVALVDLLTRWGVKPQGVVGHSSGEIGAAYAAGILTASEAILVAYYRGLATMDLGKVHRGGMAAIGLGREAVTSYLRPGVSIGCENSDSSTTLTGDLETLEQVVAAIRKHEPEIFVRALNVNCAYHSQHMKTVETKYRSMLGNNVHATEPDVPFFSSVTGSLLGKGENIATSYWVQNLISPVLFFSAVTSAIESFGNSSVLLEIGPHSALAGPVRQIIRKLARDAHYVPTLIRHEDAYKCLLKTAGELWITMVAIRLTAINPAGELLTDLPTYSWNYDGEFWCESRLSKESRQRKFGHHDILGARVVESPDFDPVWRNVLRLESVPWLRDHEVANNVLFPGAGYVAMIGEAIRQLSGNESYSMKAVSFVTALIINGGKPVEVQTHLRKIRLTTSLDSDWYEFSIASLNEGSWTKHCVGQAKGSFESKVPGRKIQQLPRKVLSSGWYRVLMRLGLCYGPRFRGLKDISAAVSESKAVATVVDSHVDGETPYQLHPSTIDSAFQLFGCAVCNGIGRLFSRLSVPTFIEELSIEPARESISIEAVANTFRTGALVGDLVGVSAGLTVINVRGLRMSPLGDNDEMLSEDPHAAVELEWKSDVNLLDPKELMQPVIDISKSHPMIEQLAIACMIESAFQLADVTTTQPHLEKFRKWLGTMQASADQSRYVSAQYFGKLAAIGSTQRLKLIDDLLRDALETEASAPALAIHRVLKHSAAIFQGYEEALDTFVEDGVLTRVYDFMQLWDCAELFELLGHSKPDLKILEIGAGTGGTTATILPHLKSTYGEKMFGVYKYTDISAGFFSKAKERFKNYQGIEYGVLDISQDPLQQGFDVGYFDLVVATNVLHATPNLNETLRNVHKLLHPCGRLFLQELDPSTKWINYVMGVLPGWWLGEHDGRPVEPYVSADRWNRELRLAGFGGIDSISHDGHLLNNIIARPARKEQPKRLTILSREHSGEHIDDIIRPLINRSYELDICNLNQAPKPGQDILSVLDVQTPFLYSANEAEFAAFKNFLQRIQNSGILWVTGASQIQCCNPNYSLILGMARTIRNELGIEFATLELENLDSSKSWEATSKVLAEFQYRVCDPEREPNLEYAFFNDRVQIGRFHWIKLSQQLEAARDSSSPRRLDIIRPGILQTLSWKQKEPHEVKTDWVEIEARAVGLNFKDVLIAMGIVDISPRGLGCELSGIVKKTGADVKHLKEGDRVLCCTEGSFSTTLLTKELLCVKIPESLNFVDASTIPSVYCTAIYGLIDMARLSKGQTVLIHSACGGVGLAAIQVAKMIGAEIFCSVGNQDKIEFIMQTFGIPQNHIFNSRDASFLPDVLRETNGKGVDVVLNSLSGELLHNSWKCVAEFGTMIEIGKRDFIGHGSLAMNVFERNRTFTGLDLTQLCTDRPHVVQNLLLRAIELYEQGYIKPIRPVHEFEAAHVEDAMRYMQRGQHIGKIVVTMPYEPLDLSVIPSRKELILRRDSSYLCVGGFGGLGRSIAAWLVEKGARHLIFLSRSAGEINSDDPYIKELAAQGCSVQTVSGSVSSLLDVKRAVSSARKAVAGVIQASMVLDDAFLNEMKFEQWQAASSPKVEGTWNLHEALLEQDHRLDFFLLLSSISGIGGQIGQANYAAANTFLDAFVQYRHSLGLPASVLDIGVMEDVGYLSENNSLLDALKATSLYTLHEQDLLDSIQLMIDRSDPKLEPAGKGLATHPPLTCAYVNRSQVCIGVRSTLPFSAPGNRTIWKKDRRMGVYRNLESASLAAPSNSNPEDLKQLLQDCQKNPALLDVADTTSFLAKRIGITLFEFMMKNEEDLDLDIPLSSLGVDSLVSIELRNWFRQKVGVEFSVLDIANSRSLIALEKQVASKLKEKFQARA